MAAEIPNVTPDVLITVRGLKYILSSEISSEEMNILCSWDIEICIMIYQEIVYIFEMVKFNYSEFCWFSIVRYIYVHVQFQVTLLDSLNDIPDFHNKSLWNERMHAMHWCYLHVKQISISLYREKWDIGRALNVNLYNFRCSF